MDIKKLYKVLYYFGLAFSIILNIGCRTYKTDLLGWNGAPIFQHTAKIIRNRTEFIEKDWGIDTVYNGVIKTKNGLESRTQYKYKTRIMSGEKSRFYLIEFTDLNSKQIDGVWYDINENEILLAFGPAIPLPAKYSGRGFTKALLARIFFVWKNRDYWDR